MWRLRLPAVVAALCVVTVAGAAVFDGPAPAQRDPSLLRARAIELVDGDGRTRAQINVEPGGEVVFRLRDQDGNIRVKLGADRSGSGLLLLDERTEPGVQALAGRDATSVTVQRRGERSDLKP